VSKGYLLDLRGLLSPKLHVDIAIEIADGQ